MGIQAETMGQSMSEMVTICVGRTPSDLEQRAARELSHYLAKLFHVNAQIGRSADVSFTILIGDVASYPQLGCGEVLPDLSNQGFVLRTIEINSKPGLLIVGGSPVATLWGVYELVERLGVQYTVNGDVIPAKQRPFDIPKLNETHEPGVRLRMWRQWNTHCFGPESWGLDEQRRFIDQLVKMKFNGILLNLWASQPFVHFEFHDVKRSTAELFRGIRFPTGQMIGRECFGDADQFVNLSMPPGGEYKDRLIAGRKYMHGLMAYAHSRGMSCALGFSITEFTDEFIDGFKRWCPPPTDVAQNFTGYYARKGIESAGPDPQYRVYQDFFNPVLTELVDTIIRAHVDEYPEADYYVIGASEFRSSLSGYDQAWQKLDHYHQLSGRFDPNDLMAHAETRDGQRAVNEVQGDIELLYFLHKLFHERNVLSRTARDDATILVGNIAPELYPVLGMLFPEFGYLGAPDAYSAAKTARHLDAIESLRQLGGPKILVLTLNDDNIAYLPQHVARPTQSILPAIDRGGFDGYVVRYWLSGDLDPGAAFLAKVSWCLDATPDHVLASRIKTICGDAAVAHALKAFQLLDELTNGNTPSFPWGFPVANVMRDYFRRSDPPSERVVETLQAYENIAAHFQAAHDASGDAGKKYLAYFLGRCQFICEALPLLELTQRFGAAYRNAVAAREEVKVHEAWQYAQEAMALGAQAKAQADRAIKTFANIARDQSDRGLLATLNKFVYQYLEAQAHLVELDLLHWSVRG